MIRADEITCQIADPNAVKVELIDCSTSLIDSAKGLELMWLAVGSIGAFLAMVITIFMAHFAWKAWNTSESQLKLTREISLEQQRLPALTDFVKALRSLSFIDTSKHTPRDSGEFAREAQFMAEIWAISYPRIFDSGVLGKIVAGIENDAARCYRMIAEEQANGIPSQSSLLYINLSLSASNVNQLLNAVTQAAYSLHRRKIEEEEALDLMEKSLEKFRTYWEEAE